VTRGNTFAEAQRLGEILGESVLSAIAEVSFRRNTSIAVKADFIDVPRRALAPADEARSALTVALDRLARLRQDGATAAEIRTAECDVFGAEEAVALSEAARNGKLEGMYHECLPAEVQVINVGPWSFVGWPCEAFVEFALEVKRRHPGTFVISLANGELRGYLVTQEAVDKGWYEAGNALMQSPAAGRLLVAATLRLLPSGRAQ
jgi:hypothetical protein